MDVAERPVKPQLKQTRSIYGVGDTVYVQGPGIMIEIEDSERHVRGLLTLLDGTRTIEDVEAEFQRRMPGMDFDARAAIAELNAHGVLMNGAQTSTLDGYGLERWKRNLGFFETYCNLQRSHYAMQEQLRDCRVTMLGLGGVGSHLAYDVLGLGIEDLRIVDYDTVELSNLNRQILYTEADLGRAKVEVAAKRLRAYSPRARIEAVSRRLTCAEDVLELVRGRDLAFCVADRPKMQIVSWANTGCVAAGVPFMSGGVDTQRSILYTIVPGRTGCVECWRRTAASDPTTLEIRRQMEERHGEKSVGPDMAAFGPLVTTLTAMMVTELVRLVTGIARPIALGRLVEIRFDDLVLREAERWERLADCPVCRDTVAVRGIRTFEGAV